MRLAKKVKSQVAIYKNKTRIDWIILRNTQQTKALKLTTTTKKKE